MVQSSAKQDPLPTGEEPPRPEDPDMIDLPAAAGMIGFPYQKIWELTRDGVIPSIRAGRTFRVPRALFEEARQRGRAGPLVLEEFAAEWAARTGAGPS